MSNAAINLPSIRAVSTDLVQPRAMPHNIEAEQALHQLVIGQKAVKVQKDGRMVEYRPANAGELKQYIQQLKQALSKTTGRRPAGVIA